MARRHAKLSGGTHQRDIAIATILSRFSSAVVRRL